MDDKADNIARIVRENTKPVLASVTGNAVAENGIADGRPFAIVPNGMEVKSLKNITDQYLSAPERRKGTAKVSRIQSFTELTNRFKDVNSALFAKGEIKGTTIAASLTAVLDYHPAMPEDKPNNARFGQHQIVYDFPVSKEFAAWIELDGKAMDQADFAAMIEDRIGDIIRNDPQNPVQFDGMEYLMPKFADPATMLELSQGMEVYTNMTVKGKTRLQSGETQIEFLSEHKTVDGGALNPPDFFLICVPVFEMGAKYRLPVRLRYRIHEGKVVWFYQLYRAEKAFDNAFDEACETAQEHTSLPLFWGTP